MRRLPKVSVPQVHRLVPRPRLDALLIDPSRPATWLSGQAGIGKTSCAASIVRQSGRPCVWLTVDADDADAATFFYYLTEAAKGVATKHRPLSFTPDYKDGLPAFARRYTRDLVQCLPSDALIVIDNLEAIAADGPVQKVIVQFIKEITAEQNLLITSRAAPPPAYASLLMQGQLGTLDNTDLQFTEKEAEHLRQMWGEPSGPSAKSLRDWAHGWAAAMVLGLENPGRLETELPDGGAPQAVFDYFAAEVLEGLSAEEQDVLLRTSLFPQFAAKQASAICDQPRAEAILEHLVDRNFFVVRFFKGRKTQYRYHPLFRAFLRNLLTEKTSDQERRRLFLDAATLMIEANETESAIALVRAAEDWTALEDLVCTHAEAWLANGFHHRVLEWTDVPSQETHRAAFHFWRGMARLPYGPERARKDLVRAHKLYVADDDLDGTFLSAAAVMESILFSWSSFEELDGWMDIIDEAIDAKGRPSLPIMGRVAGMMYSANLFRRLGHPSSERWEKTAKRFLRVARVIEPGDYILLANSVLVHDLNAGHVDKGRALVDSLDAVRNSKRVHPNAQVAYYAMVSVTALYTGNWNTCLEAAEEGLALGKELGIHFWDPQLSAQAAAGAAHCGNFKAARRYAEYLSADAGNQGHLGPIHEENTLCLIALVSGDFSLALVHARRSLENCRLFGSAFIEHSVEFFAVQALIRLGEFDDARTGLARARPSAIACKCPQSLARCDLLEAEMYFAEDNVTEARAALQAGLAKMREFNLRSLPVWYPESFRSLCAHALNADIEVDLVRELIAYHHFNAPSGAEDVWPETVRFNVLGESSLHLNGQPIAVGKAQKRPLALLQVLAALGGVQVPESQVAAILWPDAEGDAAAQSMKVTVHRLRKMLGDRIVHRADGLLTLDRACRVDAIDCATAFRTLAPTDPKLSAAIAAYRGPLLPGVDDAYVLEPRRLLEQEFSRAVLRVFNARLEAGETDRAHPLLEQAIRAAPGVEAIYAALFRRLRTLGKHAEAADVLRHCEVALFHFHQVRPSEELYALAEHSDAGASASNS